MRMGAVPTLAELLDHPDRVDPLPVSACGALVIQAAAFQERYAVLQQRLGARLGVLATRATEGTAPALKGSTDERLLSVPEVAKILGVPKSEVYALARRGVMPTVRVGPKYVRVHSADLEAWIQARRGRPMDAKLCQRYSGSRADGGCSVPAAPATARPHAGRAGRADGRHREHGRPVGARRAADLGAGGTVPPAPGGNRGASET